jgi:hypothetical protein
MTDKRSVFTDALETLGTIIDENQKRDAIHLAVEPVIAKEWLDPGQHVSADGSTDGELVGIVDPFLEKSITAGERFWLVLYPRTIKSLRHVWEHPAFPPSEVQVDQYSEIEKSKKWIADYVKEIQKWDNDDNCYGHAQIIHDYYDLIRAADDWVSSDEYDGWLIFGVDNEPLNEEFWHHYEIVRGKKVKEDKKKNFFRCGC